MRKLISMALLVLVGVLATRSDVFAQAGPHPTLRLHVTNCDGAPYIGAAVTADLFEAGQGSSVETVERVTNDYGNAVIWFDYQMEVGDVIEFVVTPQGAGPSYGNFVYQGGQGITEFIPGSKMTLCQGYAQQPVNGECCTGPWSQNPIFYHVRY